MSSKAKWNAAHTLMLVLIAASVGTAQSTDSRQPLIVPIAALAKDFEVIQGNPDTVGEPFVMRIRELPGTIIPPHKHPVDEHITVVQGTIFFGIGDKFDRSLAKEIKTGGYAFIPKGTTMFGFIPDGAVQMTSTTETLELSRAPLAASLFDIPAGYQQTSSQQDLYAVSMPSMSDIARDTPRPDPNRSRPNAKSVALNVSYPSVSPAARAEIDQYLRDRIAARGYRTAAGSGDYVLNIEVRQVKESAAGKVGGLFGKVTGIETKVGKVDIDMSADLSGGATGQAKVKNKFDGPQADAIRSAVDQMLDQVFRNVRN